MSKRSRRHRRSEKAASQLRADPVDALSTRFEAGEGEGDYDIPRGAMCFDLTFDVAGFADHTGDADSESAEGEDSGGEARQSFRGVANSGGVILNHAWWGNFAIDMDGLEIPTQAQPVLRDHDTSKILGVTSKIEVNEDRQLVAEGSLFDITADGEEVLKLMKAGFPFQMSVYVPPSAILDVSSGESVEVNGHTLEGPGTVFTKSKLLEVTITPLGADANTGLALLSAGPSSDNDTLSLSVSRLSNPKEEDMTTTEEPTEEGRKFSLEEAQTMAREAAGAERSRLSAIDEHAADTGVPAEFVAELKADPDMTADAAGVAILKKSKSAKGAMLAALASETPDTNNDPDPRDEGGESKFTETGRPPAKLRTSNVDAMPMGEDRFKAEFEAKFGDAESFNGTVEDYVSFREFTTKTGTFSREAQEV